MLHVGLCCVIFLYDRCVCVPTSAIFITRETVIVCASCILNYKLDVFDHKSTGIVIPIKCQVLQIWYFSGVYFVKMEIRD